FLGGDRRSGTERRGDRDLDRRGWNAYDGSEALPGGTPDPCHHLRRRTKAWVFRGEGVASGHGASGNSEEYSGLRSELAQSDLRGDKDHGARAALQEYLQGHRRKEADHDRERGGASDAAGSRVSEGHLRSL